MPHVTTQEKLQQLEKLNFDNDDDIASLQAFLKLKNNLIAAKAAKCCAEHQLFNFCPELLSAFQYFVEKPEKDKGCFAKSAIVKALYELDYNNSDFYGQAITVRQPEPVWGGTVDTAVDVRCWAAYGLTLSPNTRIILQLVELLHDPEPQARLGAVKAIANTNPTHAEILLREKVLDGDVDGYIIGECFHQLIAIEPDHSLEFIQPYLYHDDEEWVEYAALAIAESHDSAAFTLLRDSIEQSFYDAKKHHLIKAMALHRSNHAIDFLLAQLTVVGRQEVESIIEALSIHRSNDGIRQRIKDAVNRLKQATAINAFNQFWN